MSYNYVYVNLIVCVPTVARDSGDKSCQCKGVEHKDQNPGKQARSAGAGAGLFPLV